MFNIEFWVSCVFRISLLFLMISCGELKVSTVEEIKKRISPAYVGPPEPPYCSQEASLNAELESITVEGIAKYEYREFEDTSSFQGLGDIADSPNPIRYAEYVVIDGLGQQIQCGETDDTGHFSFTVPHGNEIYRLRIRSRANNNFYKVSVIKSPETSYIYFIEKAFKADKDQNFKTLVAPATGSLLGGAFFIMDQIYESNKKLRELAGNCSVTSFTGCTPFIVASKIEIYWEKGFNPGSYLGSSASSFFLGSKNLNRLFILGGINGDVDLSDTDHFDKSIIIHEYFHFLEYTFNQNSILGGFHDGNSIIDPRLAWSEGSANFFQAVITGIPRVLDSLGNKSGFSPEPDSNFNGLSFNESVELRDIDIPKEKGEGEFREFSVARLLWDSFDDTEGETHSGLPISTSCLDPNIDDVYDKCAKNGFENFWSVFTGTQGLNNPHSKFISIGLFHKLHSQLVGSNPSPENNLSPLRISEFQSSDRKMFGQELTSDGSCIHTDNISPPFTPSYAGEFFPNSFHSFQNMKFFTISHNNGPFGLKLDVTFNNSLTAEVNLHLFSEFQNLREGQPIASDFIRDGDPEGYSKSIEVSHLDSGSYMVVLDVKNVSFSNNGSLDISLKFGNSLNNLGETLCLQ